MFFNRRAFATVDSLRRVFSAAKEQRREGRPKRDGKRAAPKPSVLRLENLEERQLLSAVSPFVGPMPSQSAPLAAESAATVPAVAMPDFSAAEAEGKTWVVTTLNDAVDDSDGVLSLREALAAANDGDSVTFAQPGTIKLSGTQLEITKSIKIDASSVWDAANNAPGITVDGDAKSRVFYITGGEVELSGICVYNGKVNSGSGGGFYAYSGSVTLTNSTVSGNSASSDGGGFYADSDSSVTLTNSTVSGNSASDGGGFCAYSVSVTLTNSTLSGNSASDGGGGFRAYSVSVTLTNSTLSGNSASSYGGGFFASSDSVTLTNSTLSGNSASSGGGFSASSVSVTLTNSTLSGNSASYYGGGFSAYSGSVTLTNSTLSGNSASSGGGFYADSGSSVTLTNSTLSGNIASDDGGGFYAYSGSAKLYNTIVALNEGGDCYGSAVGYNVLASDVSKITGENNYTYEPALPLFVDAENGDYRLAEDSQAIDLGNNEYAYAAGLDESSTDLARNPRFAGKSIDLGAYERESYAKSEQRGVWVGSASFELTNQLQGAVKASARWTSGIETADLGLFDLPGSFTLDTTQCPDGPLTLTFDYLDASGAVLFTETKTATVINDASVAVKRGEIVEDETWTADKVWLVVGKLNLPAGRKLTVEEGAAVKFWKGAYIDAAAGANVEIMDGAVFTRAEDDEVVGDTNKDGGNSLPKIGNSYFRGEGLSGATVSGSAVFKYLSETRSGCMTQSETWFGGQVYRITGDLTVASGATLTLAPGAILKFDPGCSLTVEAGGKLVAKGNAAQPIVFTSLYDDEYGGDLDEDEEKVPSAGDWKQIKALGDAEFDYARVLYSGSDPNNSSDGAIYAAGSSRVVFSNGTVAHSQLAAMHCDSSASLEVNSSIIADAMYGTHNGKYTNCTFDGLTYLCNTNYYYYDGSFTNCVIADVTNGYFSSGVPRYTFNNCLFWNPAGQGPQSFGSVGQNGNIWADPMFRDAANGDYRLRAGSPCIDAANGALAPATDADGAARATDAYSGKTGAPNAEGVYADIGAYEFADYASSSFDLEPIALLAPASAEVGESVLIQWTARNNGSAAVEGTWRDEIWLVSSTGREAFVGTVYTTAKIAAGDVAPCQAKVLIPATADDGDWTFAVRVNANRDVFEGVNAGNNELRAETPTAIRTAALANSGTLSLVKGAPKLLRVDLPAGQAFFFNGTADHAAALYLRENAAPTSTLYDAKGANYGTGGLALYIAPASEPRTFYLLAETNETAANIEFAVGADAALNVVGVSRSSASNLGASTLSIVGAGLTADVQFELRAGETVVEGTGVAAESGASVAATFDLTGVPAGEYELVAKLNGETATLLNALNVTGEGEGARLEMKVDIPDSIRRDRVYQGVITYENAGDCDMQIPLFCIESPTGASLGFTSDRANQERLYVFGLGSDRSVTTLRAGEKFSQPFYFKSNGDVSVRLSTVTHSNTLYDGDVWSSWTEFYSDSLTALEVLNARGYRTNQFGEIYDFTLAKALNLDVTGLFGRLTDAATDVPIANAIVKASWTVEEDTVFAMATTDSSGRYVFNCLPSNADIELQLVSGGANLNVSQVKTTESDLSLDLTADSYCSVSGRLIAANRGDLSRLTVYAISEEGAVKATSVDVFGCYAFNTLTAGEWTIYADPHDRVSCSDPQSVSLKTNGASISGINFDVEFSSSVSGTVVAPSGEPVAHAHIVAVDSNGKEFIDITDENGRYYLSGMSVGRALLYVYSDEYAAVMKEVELTEGTVAADVAFSETGLTIEGRLVGLTGTPKEGLRVYLSDSTGLYDRIKLYTTSDEEGRFSFAGLSEGEYTAYVQTRYGLLLWSENITLSSGQNWTNNEITAPDPLSLTGTVSDDGGNSLSGVPVYLLSEGRTIDFIVTDSDGAFLFEELPTGDYVVQAAYDVTQSRSVSLFDEDATVDFTFDNAAKLSLDFDTPYVQTQIYRHNEDGTVVWVGSVYANSEGALNADVLRTGVYDLYPSNKDGFWNPLLDVEIRSGGSYVMTPNLGVRSVHVVSILPDAEPVDLFVYRLTRIDSNGAPIDEIRGECYDGNFTVGSLAAGTYVIDVSNGEYSAQATFEIDASETEVCLNYVKRLIINASLNYPENCFEEANLARVFFYDSEGHEFGPFIPDSEGNVCFYCPSDGEYTVVAFNGKWNARDTVSLDGGQTTASLTFEESDNKLTGAVSVSGRFVEYADVAARDVQGRLIGVGSTDLDGRFVIYVAENEVAQLEVKYANCADLTVNRLVVDGQYDVGCVELVEIAKDFIACQSAKVTEQPVVLDTGNVNHGVGLAAIVKRFDNYKQMKDAQRRYDELRNMEYVSEFDVCPCECTDYNTIKAYNDSIDKFHNDFLAFRNKYNEARKAIDDYQREAVQFGVNLAATIGSYVTGAKELEAAYKGLKLVFDGVQVGLDFIGLLNLPNDLTAVHSVMDFSADVFDAGRGLDTLWLEERLKGYKDNFKKYKDDIEKCKKSLNYYEDSTHVFNKFLDCLGVVTDLIDVFLGIASLCGGVRERVIEACGEADIAYDTFDFSARMVKVRHDKIKTCDCKPCKCEKLTTPGLTVVDSTYTSILLRFEFQHILSETEFLYLEWSETPDFKNSSSRKLLSTSGYTGHEVVGLKEDTWYYFRVYAEPWSSSHFNERSDWSNTASGKTKAHDKDPEDDEDDSDEKKSEDPNEIVGPIGADYTQVNYGTEEEPNLVIETPNWLAESSDAQNYRIYFENKASATASAQEVTVDMTMPGEWDWTTFEASTITVGNEIFALTDEYKIGYNVWLFDQASTGAKLRVEQTVDVETGAVRWYLRSWDETTPDHFPTDAYAGFLPPNDKALGTGEGNVAFSVRTKDGLTSGTRVETQATIVFDANESIDTNVWVNTYDVDAPTASFTGASSSDGRTVELTWIGSDEHSGIGFYDLYYSVDGGTTFEPWLSTDATDATFEQVGDYVDYVFKLTPYDAVGNAGSETLLSASINGTVALPPAAPADLTVGEFSSAARSVAVSWSDKSDNETGFLVQYSSDGLHWTDVTVGADAESATLTGLARGVTYTVRVAATNENGASAFVSESFTTPEASTSLDVPTSLRLGEFNEKTGAFVASWGDGSDGADGYLIEASTDGGATWSTVAQAGADATRASVSGAGLTGSFTLRVSAYNGAGSSDYAYAQVWNLADYAAYKAFALTSPAEGTVVLNGVNKDGSYTALETRELGADFYACVLGRKLTPEDFCIASDAAARLGRIDFVDPVRNNTVSVDAGDGDDLILIGSEVIETTEQIFTRNPYEKVLQYNAERFGEDSALYRNLKAKLDEAYAKMAKIVKTTKTTWGTVSIEGGANVRFIGASSVSVNAGAGDDVVKIDSLRFNYVVTGGEGSDTLSFADASGRANVDLGLTDVWQAAVVGDGGLVKLTDAFEGVVGTAYGDRIVGSAKGATVVGNGGADSVTLVGGVNDVQLVGKGQSVIARGSGVYNITLTDANYSTVNVAGVRKESAVTVDVDGDYFTFFGGPSAFDAQIGGDYAIVNGGAAFQANVDIVGDHATVTTGQGADSVRIAGDYAIANVGAGSDAVEIVGANANVALGLGDDVLTVSDGASGRVDGSFVNAGAGNDFVYLAGASGKNYVNAGAGNDVVVGGSGADEIYGIAGVNALLGMRGADRIYGGAGRDLIVAAQPVKVEEIEKDDSEALLRFYADLYEDWVVENDLEATLNLVGTQIEPDGDKDSVFAQNLDQVFVDELDGDLVNGKVWKS